MTNQPQVVAYKIIENDIKEKIFNGNLKPGDKLPSMVDLCLEYNISSTTVKKSLDSLRQAGYIYSKKRVGYFVSDIDNDHFKIKFDLNDNSIDLITDFTIESIDISTNNSISKKALRIHRIFYSDVLPTAFEVFEIALKAKINLEKINIAKWLEESESVLYGRHIFRKIDVTLISDQSINKKLMIPEESLLFHFNKTFQTTSGQFIAKSKVYIPNNICKINGTSEQIIKKNETS